MPSLTVDRKKGEGQDLQAVRWRCRPRTQVRSFGVTTEKKITLTGDFGEISLPAADISAMNYDDFDDHELIEDGE